MFLTSDDLKVNDTVAHQTIGFLDRHYTLLRRLHSLTGVIPIGAFLIPHLTTNSSIVWGWLGRSHVPEKALRDAGTTPHLGVEAFQHEVNFIHSLPALLLIEIFILWLPIAYHGLMGLYFARTGRSNVSQYGYGGNVRYLLQRVTGYIGLVYLFFHISTLRWGWTYFNLFGTFEPVAASSSTAEHFQAGPLGFIVPLFYLIGVLSLVYHFANGLWTAAITWGMTISEQAMRRWGYVCTVIGVLLGGAGVAAIAGFTFLDVEQAQTIEQIMAGAE